MTGENDMTQRWRDRRDSYRRRGEAFVAGDYGVEIIDGDGPARQFVQQHHYSGSFPAARLRAGIYRRRAWFTPELVGVAVFSVGVQPAAVGHWSPGVPPSAGVDLGRFVLLDDVPFNGETWFLRRAFAALAAALPDVRVVLSYSDPLARSAVDGRVVTPGHVGAIYQAKGARYVGQSRAQWQHLDAAGRVVSDRGLSKIRNGEVGWESAARSLIANGAPVRRIGEEPTAWLVRALACGAFRRVRHPGQHVYLFSPDGTSNSVQSARPALPYPKRGASNSQ